MAHVVGGYSGRVKGLEFRDTFPERLPDPQLCCSRNHPHHVGFLKRLTQIQESPYHPTRRCTSNFLGALVAPIERGSTNPNPRP